MFEKRRLFFTQYRNKNSGTTTRYVKSFSLCKWDDIICIQSCPLLLNIQLWTIFVISYRIWNGPFYGFLKLEPEQLGGYRGYEQCAVNYIDKNIDDKIKYGAQCSRNSGLRTTRKYESFFTNTLKISVSSWELLVIFYTYELRYRYVIYAKNMAI